MLGRRVIRKDLSAAHQEFGEFYAPGAIFVHLQKQPSFNFEICKFWIYISTEVFVQMLNSQGSKLTIAVKNLMTFSKECNQINCRTRNMLGLKFYTDSNSPQESSLLVLHLLGFDPKTSSLFSAPAFGHQYNNISTLIYKYININISHNRNDSEFSLSFLSFVKMLDP